MTYGVHVCLTNFTLCLLHPFCKKKIFKGVIVLSMILLSHSFSVAENRIGDKGATALSGALKHCNQIEQLQ